MIRTPEYYERQREYDRARRQDPTRKRALRAMEATRRAKPHVRAARAEYDREREDERHAERVIVGVDGEGHDTPDGRHIYTYLAAVDEHGRLHAEAYNPKGLSHEECATMLLSIARNTLKFGFMFSYDVTKIIEDMPAVDRFLLMRPQTRVKKVCLDCKVSIHKFFSRCPECGSENVRAFTKSLRWRKRQYGFFNGSLSISVERDARKKIAKRNVKVWDVFRFFGCSFVEALKSWSPEKVPTSLTDATLRPTTAEERVATDEQIARILAMKNKRGSLENEDPEDVKRYCREECYLLARMMRKLIEAHEDAGIHLTRYEGAGSTATALLKANNVQDFRGPRTREMRPALQHAVASAFFGGRFENSAIGTVARPCHGYDISSAYPYALSFLPCLACGRWRQVRGAPNVARALEYSRRFPRVLTVARFTVRKVAPRERQTLAWMPLPFRDEDGSISYGTNFQGWAWAPELNAALDGWERYVEVGSEAWVYETACDHSPFGFLPAIYRQRCAWGKDGKGIPLKLGPNATYGKCAQSIGDDPPFQSWPWAGMCTATTRGQLSRMISSASDPWNVLAVATDGIYAAEELRAPVPLDTGTGDLKKPLGGWEHKPVPEGLFLAKPGLYYRLNPDLADIRARGVGRREVYASRDKLEAGFMAWDREDMSHAVRLTSRRFYGAKQAVFARAGCSRCGTGWSGIPGNYCPSCGELGDTFKTSMLQRKDGREAYGTWDVRDVNIAFDPHPKRERKLTKGDTSTRLQIRDLGGARSMAYKAGLTSPEGDLAREGKEIALEQADWYE